MNNSIKVELRGGLGNQLFQYYAGAYLAQNSKLNLKLDLTHLKFSHEAHVKSSVSPNNNFLKQLSLPGEYISRSKMSFTYELVVRKLLSHTSYFDERLLTPFPWSNSYESTEIGYDEVLEKKKRYRIGGYFQTYRYFDAVVENDPDVFPKLNSHSQWFDKMKSRIQELNPFVIHIRSHYPWLKDKFMSCGFDYYDKALNRLEAKYGERQIMIFSSPNFKASEYLSSNRLARSVIIEPPPESSDLESMLLMSSASFLVTSNSTFSWWAGKLMKNDVEVIAPLRIFVTDPNPLHYYPESWTLI